MPGFFPTIRKINFLLFAALFLPACTGGQNPILIADRTGVVLVELPLKKSNPLLSADAVSQKIDNLIHAALVQRGLKGIEPELAESWKIERFQRFRFKLRPGLRFHDGSPLTARDVVHALDLFCHGTTPHAAAFTHVKKVSSQGDLDIQIETDVPQPFLLYDLPLVKVFKGAIGAGRFRPLPSNQIDEVHITSFGAFYEKPLANGFRNLTFKYVRDDTTRYQMLLRGEGNLAISAFSQSKTHYLQEHLPPNLQSFNTPGINVSFLAFNHRDAHLKKLKVRQAIAHAIDFENIIKYRLGNLAFRSTGILAPSHADYYEGDVKIYDYNLATAERLLDEAGYPRLKDGNRFALVFKTTTEKYGNDMARVLAGELRKIGIDVQLKIMEPGAFFAEIKSGNFQLYQSRWVGVSNPSIYYRIFHSSQFAGMNRGHYANGDMDKLIDQGMSELNDVRRKEAFSRVQKLAAEDLPYVNLWHWNNTFIGTDKMKNIQMYPNGDYLTLTKIELSSGGH